MSWRFHCPKQLCGLAATKCRDFASSHECTLTRRLSPRRKSKHLCLLLALWTANATEKLLGRMWQMIRRWRDSTADVAPSRVSGIPLFSDATPNVVAGTREIASRVHGCRRMTRRQASDQGSGISPWDAEPPMLHEDHRAAASLQISLQRRLHGPRR